MNGPCKAAKRILRVIDFRIKTKNVNRFVDPPRGFWNREKPANDLKAKRCSLRRTGSFKVLFAYFLGQTAPIY